MGLSTSVKKDKDSNSEGNEGNEEEYNKFLKSAIKWFANYYQNGEKTSKSFIKKQKLYREYLVERYGLDVWYPKKKVLKYSYVQPPSNMYLKCQFIDPRTDCNQECNQDCNQDCSSISSRISCSYSDNSDNDNDNSDDGEGYKSYESYSRKKVTQLFVDSEHSEYHLRVINKPELSWVVYKGEIMGHTIESWEKRRELNIYKLCNDLSLWNSLKDKYISDFMNFAKINPGHYPEFVKMTEFVHTIFPELELPQSVFKVGGCPNFTDKPEPDMHRKLKEGKYFFQIVGGDEVGTPENVSLYF